MTTESFRGISKERADELVIPMLMRYRYICSSAVLAYAYLHQLADDGKEGHFHYKDMATFLGRSMGQCKKYTRELREAGLIDTSWASQEGAVHFMLVDTDKKNEHTE